MPVVARTSPAHRQRLRSVWRSAGWPCHDEIELDLLAAGALERRSDASGRDWLRVTDLGLAWLSSARATAQQRRDAHEDLVTRTVQALAGDGRWAWRGVRFWAAPGPLPDTCRAGPWVGTVPDVFSIRPSSLEDALDPVVHEIKVRRGDLLADLRRPAKAAAYEGLAGAVVYVLGEAVGSADEIPADYGVWQARGSAFELLRPPRRRSVRLGLTTWLALVRSAAQQGAGLEAGADGLPAQAQLSLMPAASLPTPPGGQHRAPGDAATPATPTIVDPVDTHGSLHDVLRETLLDGCVRTAARPAAAQ